MLEYAENGDLEHFLRTEAGLVLSTSQLLSIGKQVAAGMNHLHSLNVVHRDLAPRNILVIFFGNAFQNQVLAKLYRSLDGAVLMIAILLK